MAKRLHDLFLLLTYGRPSMAHMIVHLQFVNIVCVCKCRSRVMVGWREDG